MSFGELLRSLRRAAGLSQEELAQRARLSVKAVGALERGERQRPYPNTVRALADALEVSGEMRAALMDSARRDTGDALVVLAAEPHIERAEPHTAPDPDQQVAAWELYVELVTRITVAEWPVGEGLLREALGSLQSLFGSTRVILRRHGPGVARTPGGGPSEVGVLALAILNEVVRPLFSVWHPLLLDHESRRPAGRSVVEHERSWARNQEMREALRRAHDRLDEQARLLAAVAGVPHPLVSGVSGPP
jgi:transcriptional regulator with XRE-family HTH domain